MSSHPRPRAGLGRARSGPPRRSGRGSSPPRPHSHRLPGAGGTHRANRLPGHLPHLHSRPQTQRRRRPLQPTAGPAGSQEAAPTPSPARRPRLLFWPRRERTTLKEEVPGCWRLLRAGLGGAQATTAVSPQPPHSPLPFPPTRLRGAHLTPGDSGLPGAATPAARGRWSLRYPELRSPPVRASEQPRACASAEARGPWSECARTHCAGVPRTRDGAFHLELGLLGASLFSRRRPG